jgi:aldo/keto reductase family protein
VPYRSAEKAGGELCDLGAISGRWSSARQTMASSQGDKPRIGFLTGQVQDVEDGDFRRAVSSFDAANLKAGNDRFAPLRTIATGVGVTLGQLALAWLLHQYEHVVPIPGSRTPAHIAENLAAASVELHPDTLRGIDETPSGLRPEGQANLLGD